MEFLGKLGASILIALGSLWSGTLDFLHLSQPVATSALQLAQDNSQKIKTGWFSKDAQFAYDAFGEKIEGADIESFEGIVVGGTYSHYAKDKNHIYTNTGQILPNADSKSFQVFVIVVPAATIEYAKDSGHVWGSYELIIGADPATFKVFSSSQSCGQMCVYDAEDKNHKYSQGQIVQEIKVSTDGIIGYSGIEGYSGEGLYTRKDGKIYYDGVLLPEAKSDFSLLLDKKGKPTGYAKDSGAVFNAYWAQIIQGADPITFEVLNEWYARDKHAVYSYDFAVIYDSGYAVGAAIKGADVSTFQLVLGQSSYDAQDKNNKYLQGKIVQDNSQTSATTRILNAQGQPSLYFTNGTYVYWKGSDNPNYVYSPISSRPGSFRPLQSHDLYSDGHQVFQWDQIISNDARHFEFISSSTNEYIVAKDSLYYYMGSHQSAQVVPTQYPERWITKELQ